MSIPSPKSSPPDTDHSVIASDHSVIASDYSVIDTQQALEKACLEWRRASRIALDTEFVRERTFFPALGLLQVNDGQRVSLVDPLAIDDLSAFSELLADPKVLKILHSCSEDLEVFDVHLETLPDPLFDTQVAATLLWDSHPPGYARLIDRLFGVEVPKGETRSNWLKRPLREAQLHYAALDVAYLLPAQERLDAELTRQGRGDWLEEEMTRLLAAARSPTPDEELYLNVGRARLMNSRQLAALRDLYAWRQREARRRDLPRSFIVRDKSLTHLAQRQPRSFDKLADIDDLDRRTAERHGRTLLRILREVRDYPEDSLPPTLGRPVDLSQHKSLVKGLKEQVKRRAQELGLAPEVLANRRTVEALARRKVERKDPVLPRSLREGWRFEAVGRSLLDAS